MMRQIVLLILLGAASVGAQNTINWSDSYELQLSDFRSAETEIGNTEMYGVNIAGGMAFMFSMTRAEFMFTKNFNPKVSCEFRRDGSSLIAPDSITATALLNYARFQFDLSELYARKLRQKLFFEKGTFSDADFFRPYFEQVEREFNERNAKVGKQTDLGRKADLLAANRDMVKREIADLAEFCRECKPKKRR